MFGDAAYDKWISNKKADLKNISPIWGFDRNNMQATEGPDIIQANLYYKGPVLLHRLSERIGDKAFLVLCNEMVRKSVSSTAAFLTLLEKNHGSEVRDWFEDLLKSY